VTIRLKITEKVIPICTGISAYVLAATNNYSMFLSLAWWHVASQTWLDIANVFKAVRRGVASDYRLTLKRLNREARPSYEFKKNLKQQLRAVDDEEKRKGKKEKEKRSKKWAGPAHQAAHVPVPLLAWLILIPSRALSRSPPLIPPPFIPPRRRFPLLLCHLRSSLRCSAPLPRCSPSRSTAATVPF